MDDKFRSRKFALAMIAMVVSSLAVLAGKMDGGSYVGALAVILGLYGAANVGEKAVAK